VFLLGKCQPLLIAPPAAYPLDIDKMTGSDILRGYIFSLRTTTEGKGSVDSVK